MKKAFYQTLQTFSHKYYTNYLGINTPTSDNLSIIKKNTFAIIEFFLFNINGLLIMNYNFYKKGNNITNNSININNETNLIQHSLIYFKKLNQLNQKKNFITYTIYLERYKIVYLFHNKQILVGKFKNDINNYYCYLCLKFVYISLINFKFDINEKISMLYTRINDNNLNYKSYKIIDELFQNQSNLNINENDKKLINSYNNEDNIDNSKFYNQKLFSFNDYLEIKIYENYFLKYLLLHFNKVFDLISHREELFLSNIKLKNVYYIDLEKQEIIFDYNKINNRKIRNIKFYKNEKILNHCISCAKKLELEYKNNLRNSDLEYIQLLTENFVKFECTSSYPRYSFYIKYLPILNGIAIIHIYFQKKLSRQAEKNSLNSNYPLQAKFTLNKSSLTKIMYKKFYYEFITVFSNNNKTEDNFKYYEPEKIYNIQKFFFEFFIALTKQNDIYYYIQKNRVAKYFNKNILNEINSVPSKILKEKSIEKVFNQINLKLENLFLKIYTNENKNNSKEFNHSKDIINISQIFIMEEEFILLDLFKDLINQGPNCIVKFDSYKNIKTNSLLIMKDINSIYPSSHFITDNSDDVLISKENGSKIIFNNIKKNNLVKKEISKKSSLKLTSSDYNNFSSFEIDDSSINMTGISRKISNIFEKNNEKNNRKEFFNHRKNSFFEESDTDNNNMNYKISVFKDNNNLKRATTFENGNYVLKFSNLKLGKNYPKDIVSKKLDLFSFSGSFGRKDDKKKC